MTADITKARGQNASPVEVPLYKAPRGTAFSEIATMPIANTKKEACDKTSILSLMVEDGFTDLQGTTVRMVSKAGGQQYEDVVEIVGMKQASYIVRIDGVDYAVRKAIVRFCVND